MTKSRCATARPRWCSISLSPLNTHPIALMARNSLNCVSKRSLYSLNSGINIWYSPWSRRLVDITYSNPFILDPRLQRHVTAGTLLRLINASLSTHRTCRLHTRKRKTKKWLWTAASSAVRCGIAGLWFILADTTMTDVALKFCTACCFPRPRVKDRIQNDESWNYTEYNVNTMVLPGVPVIAWSEREESTKIAESKIVSQV